MGVCSKCKGPRPDDRKDRYCKKCRREYGRKDMKERRSKVKTVKTENKKSNPQELLSKIMSDLKPKWDSQKQERESESEGEEYQDVDPMEVPVVISMLLEIDDPDKFDRACYKFRNENPKTYSKYRGRLEERAKDLGL